VLPPHEVEIEVILFCDGGFVDLLFGRVLPDLDILEGMLIREVGRVLPGTELLYWLSAGESGLKNIDSYRGREQKSRGVWILSRLLTSF
jgi:hypothetical protein